MKYGSCKYGYSKSFVPALLASALCLALPIAAFAQTEPVAPAPLKIADQRNVDLRLGAQPGSKQAPIKRAEIRTADASFIKVHFDRFSLPAGVTLEVASPDGREVYRYSAQQLGPHTVAADLGQDGKTSFSAMSISGPVAVLRLVGTAREPWRADHGVSVSRYLEGYPEDMLPDLQNEGLLGGDVGGKSICGTNNKQHAACYSSSDTQAFNGSKPVARAVMSGGSLCTAWRVSSSNRMFTNNHCISTAAGVSGAEFWFNYQRSTCTGTATAPVTKVAGDAMLKTDVTLDYTLFTVKNFSTISSFGFLGLDPRAAVANEGIFIAGHPGGRVKELSVADTQNSGGKCRVDAPSVTGNAPNSDVGYYCDTEGGSSGSPVIARSSSKVIALHHFGGCFNSGAKMSLIWPQVSTHFGGVIP
ncbi:trypsin-like serine peptidase [Pseudomonas sp. CGJS7]|uniref:trypsin-like serine peptidase n=1 Tax=Pseudomonas sp. CGJS7 TaxID=3109348 RepID=UPI00300B9973